MLYYALEYSELILAFQLQFGTYEVESKHFRSKKKNAISTSGFQDEQTFHILVILLMFDF